MQEDVLALVTYISVVIILVAFIVCYIYVKVQKRKESLLSNRRWIEQLPSLISTLGVLGTFLGITLGLIYFDPDNLNSSIPLLLNGLKTAFFTSLAGMTGSLILSKQINSSFDKKDGGVSDINVAAGLICKAVKDLQEQSQQHAANQTIFNRSISNALSVLINELQGTGAKSANMDSALTSIELSVRNKGEVMSEMKDRMENLLLSVGHMEENIAAMRESTESVDNRLGESLEIVGGMATAQEETNTEITKFSEVLRGEVDEIEQKMDDTNKLLVNKFDEFSELLKKSNTEALVEVMKKVTEEFQKQMNSLISKLIQENFEQLNNSVERLNVWQQENKEMIVSLTKQYKDMTTNFEQTSNVLTKVRDDTKQLVSEGGKLEQLVIALNEVLIEDKQFVEITNGLTEAATLTKDSMLQYEESTKALNEWVRKQRNFVDGVHLLIEKLNELNKLRDYNEQFWQGTKQSMEEGVGIITKGSRELKKQLTDLDKQFYARLSTTLAGLDDCIQALITGNRR